MPTDCPRWSSDLRGEPFFSIALNRKRTSLASSPEGDKEKTIGVRSSAFSHSLGHQRA
jgi:hypothetical protein